MGEIAPSALAALSGAYVSPPQSLHSVTPSTPGAVPDKRQYYEKGKSWCSGTMKDCRCERGGRTLDARVLTSTATEMLHMTMEYLDLKDYGQLGRVCRTTATICRENMHYWRKIIHKFGYAYVLILTDYVSYFARSNHGQTHFVQENYPPQKKEFNDIVVY